MGPWPPWNCEPLAHVDVRFPGERAPCPVLEGVCILTRLRVPWAIISKAPTAWPAVIFWATGNLVGGTFGSRCHRVMGWGGVKAVCGRQRVGGRGGTGREDGTGLLSAVTGWWPLGNVHRGGQGLPHQKRAVSVVRQSCHNCDSFFLTACTPPVCRKNSQLLQCTALGAPRNCHSGSSHLWALGQWEL